MNHSRRIGLVSYRRLVAERHTCCGGSCSILSSSSSSITTWQQPLLDREQRRGLVHVETTTTTTTNNKKSGGTRQRRRSRVNVDAQQQQPQARLVDRQNIPSYKEFVHRFTVLSLYRNYFKTLRRSKVHNEDELQQQIRHEFKAHSQDTDPFNIQRALQEGQRRLEELQDFTGQNHSKYDQDIQSWINIDDKEDPRGRVGQGWPWQK